MYIWKKQRRNTGNVNLLACANYYFNKTFCFNHLVYYTYITLLLIPHNNAQTASSQKHFFILSSFENCVSLRFWLLPTLEILQVNRGDDSELNELYLCS